MSNRERLKDPLFRAHKKRTLPGSISIPVKRAQQDRVKKGGLPARFKNSGEFFDFAKQAHRNFNVWVANSLNIL